MVDQINSRKDGIGGGGLANGCLIRALFTFQLIPNSGVPTKILFDGGTDNNFGIWQGDGIDPNGDFLIADEGPYIITIAVSASGPFQGAYQIWIKINGQVVAGDIIRMIDFDYIEGEGLMCCAFIMDYLYAGDTFDFWAMNDTLSAGNVGCTPAAGGCVRLGII